MADTLCAGLPARLDAVCAQLPAARPVGLGVVCAEPDGRALFMYADVFGCTGYRTRADDLPRAFRPRASGRMEVDAAGFYKDPSGLIESRLTQASLPDQFERPARIARVVTWPIAAGNPAAIMVAAFGRAAALDAQEAATLEAIGVTTGSLLHHEESPAEEIERLRRLEALGGLLPALFQTLDVRAIFDTLSRIAKDVLPHDFASVGMFNDSFTHLTMLARSANLSPHEYHGPMPYPPVQTAAWACRFVRDLAAHPVDSKTDYGTQLGGKSSIRVPIRLDDRLIGALNFTSRDPVPYTALDLAIGGRVADYVALAVSHQRLAEEGRRAAVLEERNKKLEGRVQSLMDELDTRTGYRRVTGESLAWKQVLTQATKVAATDTTALLLGESGTGKEVVARFLHRASPRSSGPFVALNCAALPEQLLEAELFGYERGAYTGATQSKPGQLELAAGGTLFLDEVAEMSPSAQAKFLRVLQEREFQRLGGTRVLRTDARIVAATNRDLQRAMTQNQFREDLYYRLNVFAITLPPLRERLDDVLPLSEAFLAEFAQRFGRPPAGVSREARRMLVSYHWPGNVRELHNSLERAAILCEGGLITPEHLSFAARQAPPPPTQLSAEPVQAGAGELPAMERSMIADALAKARFNKSKAAKALGLTRQQLYVRMRRHGLE